MDSWYLAVSEEFPFFDLFLGADCIGVLPNLRVLPPSSPAILGSYPGAPGKGSPCVLRRFSAGPGCFGFFLQILPIFVTFLHFSSICHLRFSVFTSMHRVRDPLVFCDDSREVRDLLTFFTRFCRFWVFCVHFCDGFSLDFDISWCPARLRLTLHGVQITLI